MAMSSDLSKELSESIHRLVWRGDCPVTCTVTVCTQSASSGMHLRDCPLAVVLPSMRCLLGLAGPVVPSYCRLVSPIGSSEIVHLFVPYLEDNIRELNGLLLIPEYAGL